MQSPIINAYLQRIELLILLISKGAKTNKFKTNKKILLNFNVLQSALPTEEFEINTGYF